MKELEKKAVELVKKYGVAVVYSGCNEAKVVHSEKDVKTAFGLARVGAIAPITKVTK